MQVNIAGTGIDVNRAIDKFYNGFIAADSNKNIHITVHVATDLDQVVNPNKLKQVFDSNSMWKMYEISATELLVTIDNTDPYSRRYIVCNSEFTKFNVYITDESIFNDPDKNILEYPLDELIFVNNLPYNNGMLVHASGVYLDGQAYIFMGQSGAGKSTISRIFTKEGFDILNDDRLILLRDGGRIRAFGTPWHGEANLFCNKNADLKKIFFISHGAANEAKTIDPAKAVSLLLARSFSPFWDPTAMRAILDFSSEIISRVPSYELSFTPNTSIVEFVKRNAAIS